MVPLERLGLHFEACVDDDQTERSNHDDNDDNSVKMGGTV